MNITKRTTKAQLAARIAALEARVLAGDQENQRIVLKHKALEAEFTKLQDSTKSIERDISLVTNRGRLLAKLRLLTASGVPCHMHGDYIKHKVTGAVLAQVQRP